jgi:hypothetical protein
MAGPAVRSAQDLFRTLLYHRYKRSVHGWWDHPLDGSITFRHRTTAVVEETLVENPFQHQLSAQPVLQVRTCVPPPLLKSATAISRLDVPKTPPPPICRQFRKPWVRTCSLPSSKRSIMNIPGFSSSQESVTCLERQHVPSLYVNGCSKA